MAHRQKHRGQHPQDKDLFGQESLDSLQHATNHLSWLLSQGYTEVASLKLVGDHFMLKKRQRRMVMRAACSLGDGKLREGKEVYSNELEAKRVWIDGYNLLIGIESALSGGFLLKGMDGCWRDMASIHGNYRQVEETIASLELAGMILNELKVQEVNWLLDAPVSNSGRLKTLMRTIAEKHAWNWNIELVPDPDAQLSIVKEIIITSDGIILNACDQWFNLMDYLLKKVNTPAELLDLSGRNLIS